MTIFKRTAKAPDQLYFCFFSKQILFYVLERLYIKTKRRTRFEMDNESKG